ncbi:hypothetical protein ONZ51_g15 [Trametes cubensis]|uniref:Uncharacterized protein n=1 Tax=Trametes cubensis TaxID=1111947 RepID=A0AAD7U4Y1_9APHY|nr:hypothetical protein ONZ51_g15 [Trametes cubensis]
MALERYTEVRRIDRSPYLYPATKLDDVIQERVRKQYNGCCPLCSLGDTGVFRKDALIYYIIPPTVKGRSQMAWLVDSGFINEIEFKREDNLILYDLKILLDWEQQRSATDVSGLTTRTASPLEALSGFFSLLYTYGVSDGRQEFSHAVVKIATDSLTPAQVAYHMMPPDGRCIPTRLNGSAGRDLDLLIQLNTPEQKGRLNPYFVLVHALEMVGCGYIPADVFLYQVKENIVQGVPVAGINPIDKYREFLLKLRDLYAMRTPHEPCADPSTRNVLSPAAEEDTSRSIPRAWSYDRCMLCGTEKDVVDVPAVPEDLEGDWRWHPTWLYKLGIISDDHPYNAKSLSNIMKLCLNHGHAYKNNMWRWIPSAEYRKEMAERPIRATPPIEFDDRGYIKPSRPKTYEEDGETTKVPITFQPVLETSFDVLIFLPHEMSDLGGQQEIDRLAAAEQRVVPEWMRLRLDPEVVFAVALATLGTVYWPAPDIKLKGIEQECLAIRDRWNAQVPHNTIPSVHLLNIPEPYE